MKYLLPILALFFLLNSNASNAQSERILIEGEFGDWSDIPVAFDDEIGDQSFGNFDLGSIKISNDEDYLFFKVETNSEINLQDYNDLNLYIDCDNNAETGFQINEIGADLSFSFSDLCGTIYPNGIELKIFHHQIGMFIAPTVSSDVFEMAISRKIIYFGENLFQGAEVQIFLDSDNGDKVPNGAGGLSYTFQDLELEPLPEFSFEKQDNELLRLLSYNVKFDGLLEAGTGPRLEKVIKALSPEIIGFQEIYDHSSSQVAQLVSELLPPANGGTWYHAKAGPDIHAVSLFPIIQSASIEGFQNSQGNGAFLIDLRPKYDCEMLFISAHTPCCNNETGRQFEVDAIMAFIRDAKNNVGEISIDQNTPIVIVGDMNFVGSPDPLQTLLDGDIFYEAQFGEDFIPDWDGNDFLDAKPYVTNKPLSYTWRNSESSYSPGRLDFFIYSASNLSIENTFAFESDAFDAAFLSQYSLVADDVNQGSDHLPLIADFKIPLFFNPLYQDSLLIDTSSVDSSLDLLSPVFDLKIGPNPCSDYFDLSFDGNYEGEVFVKIIDLDGRGLVQGKKLHFHQGENEARFYCKDLNMRNGLYFIQIEIGGFMTGKKIMVLN